MGLFRSLLRHRDLQGHEPAAFPVVFSACFALAALLHVTSLDAQIYKVTDEEEGVVFTDRPENVGSSAEKSVERIEITETNTVTPVEARPASPEPESSSAASSDAAPEPTVTITSPPNESTIAMGPGNFTVSASVTPPLARGESLVLTVDGQAVGAAQRSTSWFVEGAMRGPHDLVVLRTTSRGQTIASSEPVRIYVLRPSIIRR